MYWSFFFFLIKLSSSSPTNVQHEQSVTSVLLKRQGFATPVFSYKSEVFTQAHLSQPVTSFARVRPDLVGILDSFTEKYLAAPHTFHLHDPRLSLTLGEEHINNLAL